MESSMLQLLDDLIYPLIIICAVNFLSFTMFLEGLVGPAVSRWFAAVRLALKFCLTNIAISTISCTGWTWYLPYCREPEITLHAVHPLYKGNKSWVLSGNWNPNNLGVIIAPTNNEIVVKKFTTVLLNGNPSGNADKFIKNEAILLSLVEHDSIIPFIGTTPCDTNYCFSLVFPQYQRTLRDVLENSGNPWPGHPANLRNILPENEKQNVVKGIADAMSYLHGSSSAPHIVHGDLKPENVMMDGVVGDLRPKITDFGSARCTWNPMNLGFEGGIGTERYRPRTNIVFASGLEPWYHILNRFAQYDFASTLQLYARLDVYAFGLIVEEIYRGVQPFTDKPNVLGTRQARPWSTPRPLTMSPALYRLACLCRCPGNEMRFGQFNERLQNFNFFRIDDAQWLETWPTTLRNDYNAHLTYLVPLPFFIHLRYFLFRSVMLSLWGVAVWCALYLLLSIFNREQLAEYAGARVLVFPSDTPSCNMSTC